MVVPFPQQRRHLGHLLQHPRPLQLDGKAGYAYLITGTGSKILGKGGVDGFRIKLWQAATGQVIYDNLPGLPDDSAVTEPITRGSITIHK